MPPPTSESADKTGLIPGTLVYVGKRETAITRISMMDYSPDHFSELLNPSAEAFLKCVSPSSVTWLRINGLHDLHRIEEIGNSIQLHALLMEDIFNTEQRPKMDEFEEHLYIVVKTLSYDKEQSQIQVEQLSFILGEHFVISISESAPFLFNPIHQRLEKAKGRIRKMGAPYLLYSLLDLIVDHYFVFLKQLEDELDEVEEALMEHYSPDMLKMLYHRKKQVIQAMRLIEPFNEFLWELVKNESGWIDEPSVLFFRDLGDHCTRVVDTLNSYREMIMGMENMHLSLSSKRTNDVMKVLAIFGTIFMPLTFIAGVYGMNFKAMPELDQPWGYPSVLVLMLGIGFGIGSYLKKKGWW